MPAVSRRTCGALRSMSRGGSVRNALVTIFAVAVLWTVTTYLGVFHVGPQDMVRLLAPLFVVETIVVFVSTLYLFWVSNERHPPSWVLALFSLSSLILLLGMLPATAMAVIGMTDLYEPRGWSIGLGLSAMFIGLASPYMAANIWLHRCR